MLKFICTLVKDPLSFAHDHSCTVSLDFTLPPVTRTLRLHFVLHHCSQVVLGLFGEEITRSTMSVDCTGQVRISLEGE